MSVKVLISVIAFGWGLCLTHALIWPLDPFWIIRGTFTVLCAVGIIYFLFFKKWRFVFLIGALYSSGWILMMGWYLYLFHFVQEEALEDRENKLLAKVCRDAVRDLKTQGYQVAYQGSLSVRGPEDKFVFFENLGEIRRQFFHLGDFLLVVESDGKVVEVMGSRDLARDISRFGESGDVESGQKIRKLLSGKVLEALSQPIEIKRQERLVEKLPLPAVGSNH